uniref:Uncharacterized protein n=1 Tax=Sphaerodactylus townsendi TaxID=933632 RepID=A0ACB8EEC7_9SAUR
MAGLQYIYSLCTGEIFAPPLCGKLFSAKICHSDVALGSYQLKRQLFQEHNLDIHSPINFCTAGMLIFYRPIYKLQQHVVCKATLLVVTYELQESSLFSFVSGPLTNPGLLPFLHGSKTALAFEIPTFEEPFLPPWEF